MHTGSVFTNVQKPAKIQTGTFTAIDVETGKIAWQYKAPKPMIGGALATGRRPRVHRRGRRHVRSVRRQERREALDVRASTAASTRPPISYEVNGTQYVAVAAGGNFQLDYKRGDELAIFALKR